MKKSLISKVNGFISDLFYLFNKTDHSLLKVFDREFCAALKQFGNFPISNVKTLIDVGAHEGLFVTRALKIFPLEKVIMIEPLKDKAAYLTSLNIPNSLVYEIGLSNINGKADFRVNECLQASSLLEINKNVASKYNIEFINEADVTEIELKKLDNLLDNLNIDIVDILKLDTQGSELKILQGCEKKIEKIRLIQVELLFEKHYVGAPLFCEINDFLYNKGFVLNRLFDFAEAKDGRLLQCDGWYINTRLSD